MFFTRKIKPTPFTQEPRPGYPYLMGKNAEGRREVVTPPDLDIIKNIADAAREARQAFKRWPDLVELELLGSNLADPGFGPPMRVVFYRMDAA